MTPTLLLKLEVVICCEEGLFVGRRNVGSTAVVENSDAKLSKE